MSYTQDQLNQLKADIYADIGSRFSSLVPAPTPTPTSNVYDDYPTIFDFANDGDLSPNKKWRLGYRGYNPVDSTDRGKVGVRSNDKYPRVLYQYPYSKPNTTPKWGTAGYKTSASLAVSEEQFGDIDITTFIRTLKSLRTPVPSRWEAGWIMWRFNDAGYLITQKGAHFHHYYFIIYVDGSVEFGRKDNTTQTEHQYFLTGAAPKVSFAYGVWNKVRIKHIGNHIQIWVDDKPVIDVVDDGTKGTPGTDKTLGAPPHPPSTYLNSGRLAHYNEDAMTELAPIIFNK